eukprot:TRINITY_DN1515_c0_g2_i2.p1 TRINITY_DN1515_c0_g2~~TRINITY_DN1515_c0_g2_i2.p1  ORF type:complete len:253 (-),score=35.27 TRINITY_DN1515_c0_g2_i2:697-1455(-)
MKADAATAGKKSPTGGTSRPAASFSHEATQRHFKGKLKREQMQGRVKPAARHAKGYKVCNVKTVPQNCPKAQPHELVRQDSKVVNETFESEAERAAIEKPYVSTYKETLEPVGNRKFKIRRVNESAVNECRARLAMLNRSKGSRSVNQILSKKEVDWNAIEYRETIIDNVHPINAKSNSVYRRPKISTGREGSGTKMVVSHDRVRGARLKSTENTRPSNEDAVGINNKILQLKPRFHKIVCPLLTLAANTRY